MGSDLVKIEQGLMTTMCSDSTRVLSICRGSKSMMGRYQQETKSDTEKEGLNMTQSSGCHLPSAVYSSSCADPQP